MSNACKKLLRKQQKDPMDIYFAILNRKRLSTSGCVRIFSTGRLSTLTSEKYKKREPHQISSVEDGMATEKQPRFRERLLTINKINIIR